jgi:GNAT superfamily N-acetyltransferase
MNVVEVTCRRTRATDTKQVLRLIKALTASYGDVTSVTARDVARYSLGDHRVSTIFVASSSVRPVALAITRDWFNFYLGRRCRHIDFVFVEKERRRRGIASALITFVVRDAFSKGCSLVDIEAGLENDAANNLYKRLGFQSRINRSNRYRIARTNIVSALRCDGRSGRKKIIANLVAMRRGWRRPRCVELEQKEYRRQGKL